MFTPHRIHYSDCIACLDGGEVLDLDTVERIAINQAWESYRQGLIAFDDFFTFQLDLARM